MYPSGSAPSRIYRNHKMHKFSSSDSFPKLRPIVSSKGTFNYNLACFLCDLLSTLVPSDYSGKDTFSFVSQMNMFLKWINEYNLNKPKFISDMLVTF